MTDFTDWNDATGKWGSTQGLYGEHLRVRRPATVSTMSASRGHNQQALHGTGAVTTGDYGGIGLSYCACSTVASFSQVQFTVSGSVARLRSADADQDVRSDAHQPDPTGRLHRAGSCYNYPVV